MRERKEEDSKHVDDRHTHESDVDSDEEKGPRARPPHVPGSLGLTPPSGSALGKGLVLAAPVKPEIDRRSGPKGGVQRARGALGQEVKCGRAFFVHSHAQACSKRSEVQLCHSVWEAFAGGCGLESRGRMVGVLCLSEVHLVVTSEGWESSFEEGECG